MSRYTKEDIRRIVEEEDVQFIRLQFTDVFGTLKNVAVTVSQLDRVLDQKVSFDGASIEGFARIERSDLFLHADLDTFEIFPWRPQNGKVARFICDICYADGTPFDGDPRHVLKKVIADAAAMGYQLNVGPECELFLFHTDDEGKATTVANEQASYFDVAPIDLGENARRDIILTMEEMGYEVEASHHEAAPGQHEIDLRYDEALKMADEIMTFRLVVKTIAQRHGLHASFMPKPISGQNGSGMHINMSLNKDGRNIFYDEADPIHLSQEGRWFVGGLLKHIPAVTAVTNPIVNSYKRLVPGFEAPVHIAWSAKNRIPLIRIPIMGDASKRIELRSPDNACNPYLAFAVCMAAGLDGIRQKITPPESVDDNLRAFTDNELKEKGIERLPRTLQEAVDALEADPYICSVLGEHVTNRFISAKKEEWEEYQESVSQWELDRYLERV